MAIRRASKASISATDHGKGSNLIAGYSPAVTELYFIERITVPSGGVSVIDFDEIPGKYQHLHLRASLRQVNSGSGQLVRVRINGDTGANYAWHLTYGDISSSASTGSASQSHMASAFISSSSQTTGVFSADLFDIYDYSKIDKHKTLMAKSGYDSNGSAYLGIGSGLWMNTNSVNSVQIFPASGNLAEYSVATLYGVL